MLAPAYPGAKSSLRREARERWSRGVGRRVLLVVLTIYSGLWSAGASTKSACVSISYVIQCIFVLKGRTFVRQRPAGCSKRRDTVGKLQQPGHGDTSPLHVPGGERQRNHPAGCTKGYEGTRQRGQELWRKSAEWFSGFIIKKLNPEFQKVAKIKSNQTKIKLLHQSI